MIVNRVNLFVVCALVHMFHIPVMAVGGSVITIDDKCKKKNSQYATCHSGHLKISNHGKTKIKATIIVVLEEQLDIEIEPGLEGEMDLANPNGEFKNYFVEIQKVGLKKGCSCSVEFVFSE